MLLSPFSLSLSPWPFSHVDGYLTVLNDPVIVVPLQLRSHMT